MVTKSTELEFNKASIETLQEIRNLLEEILETLDILMDKEFVKGIFEAEDEIKKGKVTGYKEFLSKSGW